VIRSTAQPAPLTLGVLREQLPTLIGGQPHASNFVSALLTGAAALQASDIQLSPALPAGSRIRLRIDGMFHDLCSVSADEGEKICARLKVLARLQVYRTRIPQEGRIAYDWQGRELDARAAFLPAVGGEHCTIRLFDPWRLQRTLDQLGFAAEVTARLRALVARPQGLIVTAGPTGSGKSTTIRALLAELAQTSGDTRQVVSIEDPVELRVPGVAQVEVNEEQGLTFAAALRAALRQSPDILAIGEIRDEATAGVAVRAALSGHLVLATLHAGRAVTTPSRLIELGADSRLLSGALAGILAQRLLPLVCSGCAAGPEQRRDPDCPMCLGAGIAGRTGAAELLPWIDPLPQTLVNGYQPDSLAERAQPLMISPLEHAIAALTGAGRISAETGASAI